ncbi:MAG TPA: hypothetical protein VGF48_25360 [Thermoanaerobaculia bacterium]|jgi:hypothetical protein
MLDQLTVESFEPHVGSSFWVVFDNGHKVELRLESVGRVMESEAARLQRTAFSLFFLGPKSIRLPQQTYTIAHDSFPEPLGIFLVPVGQEARGFIYEAVFT